MNVKRLLRDAERAHKQDPDNPVLRLKLAAALRAAGRLPDALDVYRSVAVAYQQEGRLVQALAVCRGILEIAPDDFPTRVLYEEVDAARTGAPGEEPTRLATDPPSAVSSSAPLRLPEIEVEPGDFEVEEDTMKTR